MNEIYMKDGDRVYVIDHEKHITQRDNTITLKEELVVENCIEEVQRQISDYPKLRYLIILAFSSLVSTAFTAGILVGIVKLLKMIETWIPIFTIPGILISGTLILLTSITALLTNTWFFKTLYGPISEIKYLKKELKSLKKRQKELIKSRIVVTERKKEHYDPVIVDSKQEFENININVNNAGTKNAVKKRVRVLKYNYHD